MDGILIVDKPEGWTSHDVVGFVRKRFGIKKAGHAGTLDPMATGVLVILIGACTKSSAELSSASKEYSAELTLGATSDTHDAEGKITQSGKSAYFTGGEIEDAFGAFAGTIEQATPAYSAVKYKGKKLYELARKGVTVEVKPRTVSIDELKISSIDLPRIAFIVSCSKGTYVRQLAADIGDKLGCGAYLSALRRTRSGRFGIEGAVTVDELKGMTQAELEKRLVR